LTVRKILLQARGECVVCRTTIEVSQLIDISGLQSESTTHEKNQATAPSEEVKETSSPANVVSTNNTGNSVKKDNQRRITALMQRCPRPSVKSSSNSTSSSHQPKADIIPKEVATFEYYRRGYNQSISSMNQVDDENDGETTTTSTSLLSSSKMELLLERLEYDLGFYDPARMQLNNKVVIFSQWVSMLDLIEKEFIARGYAKKFGVRHTRLDGSMSQALRSKAVHDLNTKPSTRVILMSLK
jgi:SNF2 family DNA or RNA helicase